MQLSIQKTELVGKQFFYKFCDVGILPIFTIKESAYVLILLAPSNIQAGKFCI